MGVYQIDRKVYIAVCDKDGLLIHEWTFRCPSSNSLKSNFKILTDLIHSYFIRDNMDENLEVLMYFRPYIKPLSIDFAVEPLDAIDISNLNDLKTHLKDFGYAKSK